MARVKTRVRVKVKILATRAKARAVKARAIRDKSLAMARAAVALTPATMVDVAVAHKKGSAPDAAKKETGKIVSAASKGRRWIRTMCGPIQTLPKTRQGSTSKTW
jgi:hypothetical protein